MLRRRGTIFLISCINFFDTKCMLLIIKNFFSFPYHVKEKRDHIFYFMYNFFLDTKCMLLIIRNFQFCLSCEGEGEPYFLFHA